MANEIISYLEMCSREGVQLQRGMNYWVNRPYSVVLMSQRSDAPYSDTILDDGQTLIYEGHDEPRNSKNPDPKQVDQPQYTPTGRLTENGRFFEAAQDFKLTNAPARRVRVYEKLFAGLWAYNGTFELIDAWISQETRRAVFKFKLTVSEEVADMGIRGNPELSHTRMIPSPVKQAVWKRDSGKCRMCGATDNLHFDHIIPYSKGGSSLVAENIQLLCARHNLQKHDRIE